MFNLDTNPKPLAKLNVNTIGGGVDDRIAALQFSQTFLFLASSDRFDKAELDEFGSAITSKYSFDDFVRGYTYLVTNGFGESKTYKSFEDIFAEIVKQLANPNAKSKKLAKMLHLLLLNPNLDLTHKFKIGKGESKMGIEHIFSMWTKAEKDDKALLSDVLSHLIAITPNLSAITPTAKPYCAYAMFSLVMCAVAKRYLEVDSYLTWAISLVDVVDMLPSVLVWTTALSAGYFATRHFMSKNNDKVAGPSIDPGYIMGSFSTGVPFILRGPSISERLEIKAADKKPAAYVSDYVSRKLLLLKYGASRDYMRSGRIDIRFQLGLTELATRYDGLSSPKQLVFDGKFADTFMASAKRTFNEENFGAIAKEIGSDEGKRAYFLKVYDMAEKGFIKLDVQTMYVMNEILGHVFYKKASSLANIASKNLANSLTFESFQWHTSSLLKIQREGVSGDELDKRLYKFGPQSNNEVVGWFKEFKNVIPLDELDSKWRWALGQFDEQFVVPKVEVKPQEINEEPKDVTVASVLDDAERKVRGRVSSIVYSVLESEWMNSIKHMGLTLAFGGGIVLAFRHPILKPLTIAFAVCYSVDNYYHPQIVGVKEAGKKFCSGVYSCLRPSAIVNEKVSNVEK